MKTAFAIITLILVIFAVVYLTGNNVAECSVDGDCGSDGCTEWGSNYCSGISVYHSKSCHAWSCDGGICKDSQTGIQELIEVCDDGCENGECMQPECGNGVCGRHESWYNGTERLDFCMQDCGTGSQTNPYMVSGCISLQEVVNRPGSHYILVRDIDFSGPECGEFVSGEGFEPIGKESAEFTGTFDGQEYKLTGLFINRPSGSNVGLFGITRDAVIKNLGLEAIDVTGYGPVGGLAGHKDGGIVENCYVTGYVNGVHSVGGLVGKNYPEGIIRNSGIIAYVSGSYRNIGGLVGVDGSSCITENSYSLGNVNGGGYVGGLIGRNRGTISDSYATGNVSADGTRAGGLVGWNTGTIKKSYSTGTVRIPADKMQAGGLAGSNDGTIKNCYSTGSVYGGYYAGGLVGVNNRFVINCYSTGGVVLTANYSHHGGGLIGYCYGEVKSSYATGNVGGNTITKGGVLGELYPNGTISNCYWLNNMTGCCGSGTCASCVQASSQSDFYESSYNVYDSGTSLWDFETVWFEEENGYPVLQ